MNWTSPPPLDGNRWRHVTVGLSLVCLGFVSSGCATMVHRPLTEREDATDLGIRYYGLSPYLIAYSNGKGGVATEIKYLPDPAKKMSVTPETTLADIKSTLQFENGALTSATDTGDATAIPQAVRAAVEKLGTALIAGAGNEPDGLNPAEGQVPAPYIYRIVVRTGGVDLIGGHRPEPFHVTLLPQAPPKKDGEQ